jgi:SAP domain
MSKEIDLDKPLSEEDRAWLKERSLTHLIEANDRQFGVEPEEPVIDEELGSQQLVTTGAKQSWEPGTQPENKFVQRPYDIPVTGHFATSEVTGTGEAVEAEAADEDEIEYMTVEELKEELRSLGQSTSGNKEELVNRLKKAQ